MKILLPLLLVILVSLNLNAQTETALIRKTLIDYIEGSTNGQPNRLKKAFHTDLNLYYVKNDDLGVWSGKAYIEDTKEGKPTGEQGKILSIDVENNAAVAKVEIADPKNPVPYIDYFMLLKLKGKWTIIHKMFTKKAGTPKKAITSNSDKDQANSVPQQSLAQFVYDMMTTEDVATGLNVLAQYQNSNQFYLDKNELYRCGRVLYQNGHKEASADLYKNIPTYFPEIQQSLAHQLLKLLSTEGITASQTWYEQHQEDTTYYLDDFEFETASTHLFDRNQLSEAQLLTQVFLKEYPKNKDAYELMAKIYLAQGNKQLALQYLRDGLATDDVLTFMGLAVQPSTTYIPTRLPRDTTLLFVADGNLNSDTAFVFVQGGPMPAISAYHPRPLTLLPNQQHILRIDVLQSQMINQSILSADPTLTVSQSLYEHHQSAEMLHRTVKYLKNQGKTVFVIGHSYGCYIGLDYLYTKENMADKLILMGGDLDEDLRNYQVNEDGSRKFIRWRNGTEPYERDFWGGFPLVDLLQENMEKVFVNTESLVSSHAKRRFTQLLKGKDLSNVLFLHAKFDEANARTTTAELDFFQKHGATTIESYGDHHSMLTPAYMTNIYNYLVQGQALKKSIASTLSDAIDEKGITIAVEEYQKYKDTETYHSIVETEMNTLGYQLVSAGKLKEAVEVFKLNVAAFPNSWNVYDSLGETYLSLGNKELGIANYKKSLALHPGNRYAIKALE